jgi:hypothetical protein
MGAEVSYRLPAPDPTAPPYAQLSMGSFKIPFGFEVGQADTDRLFMERTTAEHALFPGEYDLGARLQGGWRFVRYSVALMNGNPIGEQTFPFRDPTNAKDIVGRVGADTDIVDGLHLRGGLSALTGIGFHKGTLATKDTVVWRDINGDGVVEPNEIQVIPGTAATPSADFSRSCLGADLGLAWQVPGVGALNVYGEVYLGTNLDRGIVVADPVAASRDFRELGWYAAVTQDLGTRYQLGLRYDYYNPDADATGVLNGAVVPSDQSYSTVSMVAAVRAQRGRLSVEYDVNRNHLGIDSAGNPTNLADNAVIVRGQVQW